MKICRVRNGKQNCPWNCNTVTCTRGKSADHTWRKVNQKQFRHFHVLNIHLDFSTSKMQPSKRGAVKEH